MDFPLLEPENVSFIAGGLLSFLFVAVPKLNLWWDNLSPERKQAIMAALSAIVGAGIVAYSCSQPGARTTIAACFDGVSLWALGEGAFFAWAGNQSIHRGLPKSWFLPKWRKPPAADLGERPYPPGSYPTPLHRKD